VAALLTPAGREVLRRATDLSSGGGTELAIGTRLRTEGVDPDLAALAVGQVRLRERAVERLGATVADWVWTPAALEQATRPDVSTRRATRVADAGLRQAADLGCGAGSDAIALAKAGLDVHAIDLDADVVAVAQHNAAAAGVSDRITFTVGDALAANLSGIDVVMIDPARRDSNGRRLMRPEQWSPTYSQLLALSEQVPSLVAKLAPGIEHRLLPPTADTEWIQHGDDLVEATLWFGQLSRHVGRAAVLLRGNAEVSVSERDLPAIPPRVGEVGQFLYEPHAAVIRAGLVGVVCDVVSGWLLDVAIAYVTSDDYVATPLASSYRVIAEVPFAIKRLRAELQQRGYGNAIIKKRGVAVDPEHIRHSLRLSGVGPTATVVLTRTTRGPLALLVETM